MGEALTAATPYQLAGEWGFSNDAAYIESVRQYRDAAAADGWTLKARYLPTEGIERSSSLTRDGFAMAVLTRDNSDKGGRFKFEASVHIWGPDGLAITPPPLYDFAEIVARTRKCSSCRATDVQTHRYSFAGRCCEACLPKMRAQFERPGWCD